MIHIASDFQHHYTLLSALYGPETSMQSTCLSDCFNETNLFCISSSQVDGQLFFNGSPWELKARDYAAETLNAALKHMAELKTSRSESRSQKDQMLTRQTIPGEKAMMGQPEREAHDHVLYEFPVEASDGKVVTADNIIAVSAMEGVGVSEVRKI
jgi:hypothetical protein